MDAVPSSLPAVYPIDPHKVEVAPGFWAPRRFGARLPQRSAWPFLVDIEIDVAADGSPVCSGLRYQMLHERDEPWGLAAVLSAIKVEAQVWGAFKQMLAACNGGWLGEVGQSASADLQASATARVAAATAAGEAALRRAGKRRRRHVTPSLLEEVALVYREAFKNGNPPTEAVARHFNLSKSGASKYVQAARGVNGPLGPAPGKRIAGEVS